LYCSIIVVLFRILQTCAKQKYFYFSRIYVYFHFFLQTNMVFFLYATAEIAKRLKLPILNEATSVTQEEQQTVLFSPTFPLSSVSSFPFSSRPFAFLRVPGFLFSSCLNHCFIPLLYQHAGTFHFVYMLRLIPPLQYYNKLYIGVFVSSTLNERHNYDEIRFDKHKT
jgi:hypothetical protein